MKPLVAVIQKRKYIIAAGLLLAVLITIPLIFILHYPANHPTNTAADSKSATPRKLGTEKTTSPQEKKEGNSTNDTPENTSSDTKSNKQTTPNSSATTPKQTPAYNPQAPPIQETTPYFSIGPMGNSYTSCAGGVLYYTVYSTWIGSRVPTTQSFTWKLEVSDGTVSDSGVDTMPAGSSIWHNFPSTPSYPSTLGSVIGANDGDRVRIVITSPNYAASGWSAPVPTGSEEACRNGLM